MTRRALSSIVLVVVLGLGVPAAGQVADESAVPRMSVVDLKQAIDEGRVLVVDVRDPRSFADGHIPGSINVPLGDIQKQAAALRSAKKPIVTYCS